MRISRFLSFALSFVLLSSIATTTPSFAKMLNCERYDKTGENQYVRVHLTVGIQKLCKSPLKNLNRFRVGLLWFLNEQRKRLIAVTNPRCSIHYSPQKSC